jgi:hypothetical protein
MLEALPGVTVDMANSLLAWGGNGGVSQAGVYQSAAIPYAEKKAPLESMEELLLVNGWTPRLLLGQDVNRNGILDPGDGSVDGRLDVGLAPYLTVWSTEPNLDRQGNARINLNDGNLANLTAKITTEFDAAHAAFVNAFRQGVASRAGVTLPSTFTSVADLIGAQAPMPGLEPASPFTEDELDHMLDRLTTTGAAVLPGRIDVLQASAVVLQTLPGLAASDVSAIVAARTGVDPHSQTTTAWLRTQNVIAIDAFRAIEPLITVHSYQWTIESVGYFDNGGPTRRIRAVVDVRGTQPQYLEWQDLTSLGAAYNFSASSAGPGPSGP